MNKRKLLQIAQRGGKNLRFADLVVLVEAFGFQLDRISGSHHIFTPDLADLLNLQEKKGKAKPYQIRQFLTLVEEHNLEMEGDE